jgi:hypothetical protein
VLYHAKAGYRVEWWRLDTGARLQDFRIEGIRLDSPMLQWSVNGSAMLLGNRAVIDPKTGKVLWTLPPPTGLHRQRLLLTADRALGSELIRGTKSDYRLVLLTRP